MACGESMKLAGAPDWVEEGGFREKRGGAMPGAEAGEEPLEEELVAAAEAEFEPEALGWLPTHPIWCGPPGVPVPKLAATAAAAAAAKAMAATAELFCTSFCVSAVNEK